jgi:hypothetical protein
MNTSKKTFAFLALLAVPFLLSAEEFQVTVIEKESDLPEKFCPIWAKGDYLITDGKFLILIGGDSRRLYSNNNYYMADALGTLISMVPADKKQKSKMAVGAPYLRIDGERKDMHYTSLDPSKYIPEDGSLEIRAAAVYSENTGLKADIETVYRLIPESGRIDISSTIKNTGKDKFEELLYSVYFNANHSYNFSPFNRKKTPQLRFNVYPKEGHFLGWMNKNPLPDWGEILPDTLAPGETYQVAYSLFVNTDAQDLLRTLYKLTGTKPETATFTYQNYDGGLMELILSDAVSGAVFFRSFFKNTYSYDVPLPEGTYRARANFFPGISTQLFSVELKKENTCILQNPPTTRIKLKIKNSKGEHVPGKVTFIGLDPTKSPYFTPENPIKNGRNWETFKNSCYPPEGGMELDVPVGTYLIYASRGPEYTLDQKVLEVSVLMFRRDKLDLVFVIDKVVDTKKFLSVDTHMHTQYSDGRVKTAERLKSVIAEGVDVAISTDHNYINDYTPTLQKLGLDKYLVCIIGNEVTTGGVIHYNTYPIDFHEGEEFNGAIDAHSPEAGPLFKASRDKDPQAVLQINHPRSGSIGYFNNYLLDPESAAFAKKRFDTSFDVMEGMNGPYFYSSNYTVILDWLHLLNRGYYFPIVGSSDSHGIARGEPGYSRTYVYYEGEKSSHVDINAVLEAIKKGHSFSSNGPIVDYKINNKHIPGDSLTAADGKVNIGIQVQCAPWISVDEVRVIVNGERKIFLQVGDQKESITRFSEEMVITLKEDSYIAVEALGKKSLYPVLQAQSRQGLLENATLPYALTNPVFIDVDGNGKFDPPIKEKIQLKDMSKRNNKIQRY